MQKFVGEILQIEEEFAQLQRDIDSECAEE
jgi:hypothetical protein